MDGIEPPSDSPTAPASIRSAWGELLTISALTETSPEMHVHIAVLQLKALQVFRTFTASVAIGHQSDLAKAAGSSGTHQATEGLPLALKRFVQERMHPPGRARAVGARRLAR